MLAQPSNTYRSYNNHNGPTVEQSPLLYQQHSISRSENLNVQPLLHNPQQYIPQQQQAQYRSDETPTPAAQNFLSTFFRDHHQFIAPAVTHSRPAYYQAGGEPFSTTPRAPRLVSGHRSVESIPKASTGFDQSILGSGDFGVLRGGTFYQDNDPTLFRSSESSNEFSYYANNNNNKNGHGRPQAGAYVQRYTYPEDQFANFRDFADINTPNDASYSHFVVVYRNRNGTVVESPKSAGSEDEEEGEEAAAEQGTVARKYEPKNILDQLRLLDEEKAVQMRQRNTPKSKSKSKLKRTKLTRTYKKQHQWQAPKQEVDEMEEANYFEDVLEEQQPQQHRRDEQAELVDPLLALS